MRGIASLPVCLAGKAEKEQPCAGNPASEDPVERRGYSMLVARDLRMDRRDFLQATALAALALSVVAPSAAAEDRPATHNMLVFGEQTVFFSHLPMFQALNAAGTEFRSPHRFQVILQAALTSSRWPATSRIGRRTPARSSIRSARRNSC